MTPQLWVFAGPNGAGKSTLVDRHIRTRLPVVNPDDIARQIDPNHDGRPAVLLQAARLAIAARDGHLAEGRSFVLETTLTGRGELGVMRRAAAAGYRINLVYIGLDAPELSAARVAERVRSGGHAVPPRDLARRYPRSMANLPAAIAIADRALLLDNSGERARLVMSVEASRTRFVTSSPPAWAREAVRLTKSQQRSHSR